jgi:L-ascorbate metabolism protein UlaG (beta-lactamase superfamily)
MQIVWYGKTCFKIIFQEADILTDPFSPKKDGFKNPKITSSIVIFSEKPEKIEESSEKNFFILNPGEYEIKDIFIFGFPHFEKEILKTIYKIEAEEIKICFLGEISKNLTDEEIEKLGEVDILIFPVSFKDNLELINKIEPSIIIPSCWQKEKDLNLLFKEFGFKKEPLEKFKIKKKEIKKEKVEFVPLKIYSQRL